MPRNCLVTRRTLRLSVRDSRDATWLADHAASSISLQILSVERSLVVLNAMCSSNTAAPGTFSYRDPPCDRVGYAQEQHQEKHT